MYDSYEPSFDRQTQWVSLGSGFMVRFGKVRFLGFKCVVCLRYVVDHPRLFINEDS